MIVVVDQSPESCLREQFAALPAGGRRTLALSFSFCEYYLPGAPVRALLALVELSAQDGRMQISASVFRGDEALRTALSAGVPANPQQWCHQRQLPWFQADLPLLLQPIHIPKPWGQEIWFTGIEARGQSEVSDGQYACPLPWLLALAPEYWVAGMERKLNLLKILDPLPVPVFGDLYFELHEEKREVYVVTHVDQAAWPDGIGGIRFGFNQQRRREFTSDAGFVQAYRQSVQAYERVRRAIDALVDQQRLQQGVGLNDPVSATQQQRWLAQVPQALRDSEQALRGTMEDFSRVLALRVGDVVKVPCLTPHSLLHGVRTVEFQTPVYERKILSFAQKVLTQTGWDTDEALAVATVADVALPALPVLADSAGCKIEQIVDFDDFAVLRITLQPGAGYCQSVPAYALLMAIGSGLQVGSQLLTSEQALLLPAATKHHLQAGAGGPAVALIALPK
jgi:hypothetical protein